MKGGCELCSGVARVYCESDEARLCWECDARVHGANFLVARHPRLLLCRACRSPTPWSASGPRLAPSLSLCHRCSSATATARQRSPDEPEEEEMDDEDDEDEDDEEDEEEEEEGENQVVPWSSTTPPPPVASSSSSEDSSSRNRGGLLKRMRERPDFVSQRDLVCSSSGAGGFASAPMTDDEATSFGSDGSSRSAPAQAATARKKPPQHDILDLRNFRDISAVDLARSSSGSPPI